jgi:hypothetical protein
MTNSESCYSTAPADTRFSLELTHAGIGPSYGPVRLWSSPSVRMSDLCLWLYTYFFHVDELRGRTRCRSLLLRAHFTTAINELDWAG